MPLPWKDKDREDTKKLTPNQREKKKKIAAALKKDPKFKKKFGERADEVRSRIANKKAQKNESYNPYKEKLYSLLETNERGKIDDPHDPKNFGLNIEKIKSQIPGSFVSHGDIFDSSDVVHFHTQYLEHAIKTGDAKAIEKHKSTLKKHMPHETVEALAAELKKKHGK